MTEPRVLSTSEERRAAVTASALAMFARGGFWETRIADVAEDAGISPAYVSKLFPTKTELFVAAVDEAYRQIVDALDQGAAQATDDSPQAVLKAMGAAYADLMTDPDLIMLQVHAQAAIDQPEIFAALRRGIGRVMEFTQDRSQASAADIQRFISFGLLCNLLTTLDAFELDSEWASTLTEGFLDGKPEKDP